MQAADLVKPVVQCHLLYTSALVSSSHGPGIPQ